MSEFDLFATNYKQLLDKSLAISGESSEYFADYKARYIAASVPNSFSGKVLDFGCGVGLGSKFLRKYLPAATLHGFDDSSASIQQIDPNLSVQGLYTSDIRRLNHDYDLIVVANVMHHIPPQRRQGAVIDLKDRLAKNGKLFVFEHNPANPLTRWVVSRCPLDKDAVLLSPREIQAYTQYAKLRLVRLAYIMFFPRLLALARPLEPYLSWCRLGAQYVLIAEKTS